MENFDVFGFKKFINQTLDNINFVKPTSIQQKVIPLIKKHYNVVALAHTGTGKTHSFLLPIINNLNIEDYQNKKTIQALIIVPTRELAKQIFNNIKEFQKTESRISAGLFIGGEDINKSIDSLNNSQPLIAIGTPTRLKELYEQNYLKITTSNYVVIDECDMIFDLGFIDDIDFMLSKMKKNVVISMFSATISEQLRPYIKKYLKNSVFVDDSNSKPSSKNIKHILIDTKNREIEETLTNIVNSINSYLTLIFVNNKSEIPNIVNILRKTGINSIGELHGNLQPRTRMAMLKRIQNNEFKYVVATDVAARGVDINGVSHVISIDLPLDYSYYIHRSGRTGRHNFDGISYVLMDIKNKNKILELEKKGIKFDLQKFVDQKMVEVNSKKKKKNTNQQLDSESKIVLSKYNNSKIKPGYKKKRKQELENIKKKKRRQHIKESIDRIKKQKYKERREKIFED